MRPTLIAVMLALLAAPAVAQTGCAPRAVMLERLARDFKEAPVAGGVIGTTQMIELLVSPQGGWTILATRPDGIACMIATGTGWSEARPKKKGKPA